MLVGRAWPRQRAAHTSLTRPARARHPEPAGYSASVQGSLTGSAAASPFRASRSTSVAVGHRAGRSWSGATTGGSGLPVGSRAVHVPGADRARRNTAQRTGLRRRRHELQGALRALSAELDRDPGMAQATRTGPAGSIARLGSERDTGLGRSARGMRTLFRHLSIMQRSCRMMHIADSGGKFTSRLHPCPLVLASFERGYV